MTNLPQELIDHIADLAAHIHHDAPETLARLCRVNFTFRRAARRQLYHSPFLNRRIIKQFVRTLESSKPLLTDEGSHSSLVKGLAFVSSSPLSFDQNTNELAYEHEHVDIVDLLRCLSLVNGTVEVICVDMACSQVGCGWYTDPHVPGHSFESLKLSKLGKLICRCPKGYLPTCTRKLLDLFDLGRSPSLVELLLYWTGPGLSHQAPDNAESLTRTLQSCPNVRTLGIIEAKTVPYDESTSQSLPTIDSESLNLAPEVWVKSTTANGAVYRAEMYERGSASSSSSSSNKRGQNDNVTSAQAEADSDAPPTRLSESIARAARRIDRRRNTLRAHMATINVLHPSLTTAEHMAIVEVDGATHADKDLPARQRAPSATVTRDEGWNALLSVLHDQIRSSVTPSAP